MNKTESTVLWVTAVATLANLAMLIAVGAKLQVAKEDFTAAAANAAKNPFKFAFSLLKGGTA